MISLYRLLSVRHLRRRWARSLLVVASIALGVATLVATQALNESMAVATHHAVTPLAGSADLHVGNGEAGVERRLAGELGRLAGIRAVEPIVAERVLLPDLDNRHALLLGVDLHASRGQDNPWGVKVTLTNPAAFLGSRPVVVGRELAAELNGRPTIRVRAAGTLHELAIAGTLSAEGPAATLTQSVLVLPLDSAAALLERPNRVSRLDLFLEVGADRDRVQPEVERVLAGRARVETPEAHGQSLQDIQTSVRIGFSLCAMGALVVGLFLVYNALAVSVAERRHEIGILRSLGATRLQIGGLFAGEAVLQGLVGAIVGMPLGLELAEFCLGPMQRVLTEVFLHLEAPPPQVAGGTIALAAAAGVATALLAALVPAMHAATDEPSDAVRRVPAATSGLRRLVQVGTSGLLVSGGVLAVLFSRHLPPRFGSFGGIALIFVGLLLATPWLSAGLARFLQPAARLLGIEGRLAADNLIRSPGRTGLVIAALAACVALMLQTAGVIKSNERPILAWVEDTITADLFVTCGGPASAGNLNVPQQEQVGVDLAALPGVRGVLPVRFRRVQYDHTTVLLTALDAQTYYDLNRDRPQVPGLELYPRLTDPDTILVSHNFAAVHGKQVGDRITLRGPAGPVELTIVGTLVDYSWNQGSVIIDRGNFRRLFDDPLVDVFDVFLEPSADRAAAEKQVEAWAARQALFVTTRPELKQEIADVIHRFYGIAYSFELVIGIVAVLGVVTALLISVLQRQRELGLLRAVGATQAQVLRSVLAEATLMGLIGTLLGVLAGIPLEWYVVRVVILQESGFLFPVLLPWQEIGLLVVLALSATTLAGLGPALHAVRLRIVEAIAYE
jgi:putative ABC transport system permease protein